LFLLGPAGVEGGTTVDMAGGGEVSPSVGGGGGYGIKATACYYKKVKSEYTGEDCECE